MKIVLMIFLLLFSLITSPGMAVDNADRIDVEDPTADFIWLEGSELSQAGQELYKLINNAEQKGLKSEDYLLNELNSHWMGLRYTAKTAITESDVIEFEEMLMEAFLRYASDLATGRFIGSDHQRQHVAPEISVIMPELIEDIESGRKVTDILAELEPAHPHYQALLEGLQKRLSSSEPETSREIEEIILNLERWRQEYNGIEENDHLLVNIPSFRLELYENDEVIMEMKTVVGRSERPTPVLRGDLNRITVSPRWYMPTSIAVKDHLPKVKNDVEHLEKGNYKTYTLEDGDFVEVDPREINWEETSKNNFPYFFWQEPGPWNALGAVVFRFPNTQNIYLHDTPDRHYFDREDRALSSGCIRLERPLELAYYLIEDMPNWNSAKMHRLIEQRDETTFNLKSPVPIYITYFTVVPGSTGQLEFHEDIYRKNDRLRNILY
ncbi:MAG: L,D-transpeptidase family protein [Bacillota bacterium]